MPCALWWAEISGAEGLLGQTATVIEPIGPATRGRVRVLGEDWAARLSSAAASNGEACAMRSRREERLTLIVEPFPRGATDARRSACPSCTLGA